MTPTNPTASAARARRAAAASADRERMIREAIRHHREVARQRAIADEASREVRRLRRRSLVLPADRALPR